MSTQRKVPVRKGNCLGSGQKPEDTYVDRYGRQRCNECHYPMQVNKNGTTRTHRRPVSPSGTGLEALLSF